MGLFDKAKAMFNPSEWGGENDPIFGGGLGDFIPGIGDARAAEKANQANIQEARLNREFQERMSSTAYQRAMEDMKKAGLNPTLAYMQGGASAPTGAQATIQSESKTRLGDMALQATTGIGGLAQKGTALQQQQSMNESSIQLNASTAAKNVADAQKTLKETDGLSKKANEGKLWDRFYKKINNVLDSTSKDAANRDKRDGPLIKKLGPASKQESSMFKWLNKKPN